MNLRTRRLLLFVAAPLVIIRARSEVDHGKIMIEWIRKEGGFVNPKIEIRRADPSDPKSRYGMFTNGMLAQKEKLLEIPRNCLITSEKIASKDENIDLEEEEEIIHESFEDSDVDCLTVRNLIKELRKGDASTRAPYINYLLAEPWSHLPSSWSDKGKRIFNEMLEMFTNIPLPPEESTDWIDDDWLQQCKGNNDPLENNAALIVVQRSWDSVLIPVFDMMSHRNGKWLNTEDANVHHTSKPIKVRASRDCDEGEEIYTSYNMCDQCGNRYETYGTPQIFGDYGFVEQYPQRWVFDIVSFEIDETDGKKMVSFFGGPPKLMGIAFLHDILSGMKKASEQLLNYTDLPKNELASILQYNQALIEASSLALETVALKVTDE